MATISVCMIVKDEAENLGPCLDGLRGIADEIVIVDTGSTDATKKVARRYTDRIYDFAWTGDFSQARNYAFSLATQEYIYSADADERIDEENRGRFLLLKEALLPEVEIVQMRYGNQLEKGGVYNFDEEYRPKLFRRLRTFRWTAPIHETVVTAPVVFDSDIVIGHFPKERHAARDLAAFRKASQKAPLDARLQHMYAMELYIAGEKEDLLLARDYFSEVIAGESRAPDEIAEARCVALRAARITGDADGFYKLALMGAVGQPCAELCCEIGEFYFSRQDYTEAAQWFYMAASGAECLLFAPACGSWPMGRLAECCDNLGEREEAAQWRAQADAWTPEVLMAP